MNRLGTNAALIAVLALSACRGGDFSEAEAEELAARQRRFSARLALPDSGPLSSLAMTGEHDAVPDRDLMLSLSPQTADKLAERFERVSDVLGKRKKKPRFNAVLTITTNEVADAQERIEKLLDQMAKRWKLDEVVTNTGRPSEIYYILKPKKSVDRDELLTAVRDVAGDKIEHADLESREPTDDEVSISA